MSARLAGAVMRPERAGVRLRAGAGLGRALVPAASALVLVLAGAMPAAAQEVRSALMPDTATIGDVVRAVVRVELPAGWKVAFADSLAASDTVENAGHRTLEQQPQAGGGTQVTAFYPLIPWRVGDLAIAPVRLHVVGPGVDSIIDARLPGLHVKSVLPADTTKQQPKPPHDVIGPDRLLWPYILAAILALILLALLIYWLWKRLRRRIVVVGPEERLTPRERALRDLDRVRAAKLLESGEIKPFYSGSTEAVRRYLDALEPAWGADRTTSELIPRLRVVDLKVAASLARLLDRADLVKFARLRPAQTEALSDWTELRRWVETFPEPEPPEEGAGEEVRAA